VTDVEAMKHALATQTDMDERLKEHLEQAIAYEEAQRNAGMLIHLHDVEEPNDPKLARYHFKILTAPVMEHDLGRWVGDFTLKNINPYSSRALREAIADWYDEDWEDKEHDEKWLTWTVQEFFALL
jgi:hypothetical protein